MSMELFIALVFSFFMIVGGISMYLAPRLSRPEIFFGATVDPRFRESADARVIVRGYRKFVVTASAVLTVAFWISLPFLTGLYWPLAFVFTAFFQLFAGLFAFAAANKRVRLFAQPRRGSRTVSLERRHPSLPGGRVLFAGPMLLVFAQEIVLLARRASMLPEVFDAASSTLLVAFCANLLLLGLAYLAVFRTRQIHPGGSAASRENSSKRIGYLLLLSFAYSTTIFHLGSSLTAAKLISAAAGSRLLIVSVLLWVVFAGVALVLQFRSPIPRGHAPRSTEEANAGDSTPDECWNWGLVYYNPDDSAFLVEKRMGIGWTINFGNNWSWVVSAALLAGPFVIRYFWFM